MTPKELAAHKAVRKTLTAIPEFGPMKKGKLPKPFNKIGGSRLQCSKLIPVSDDHQAFFMWKNGETLADTSFFGYLMCKLPADSLGPVFEFHWHPSHKGIHCKLPCRTELDYTNRLLVKAPELALSGSTTLDPRNDLDRQKLITLFCDACGITLNSAPDTPQLGLWNSW
jgi:hypothetical protein